MTAFVELRNPVMIMMARQKAFRTWDPIQLKTNLLEFWLENSLEFWLEIPFTKKKFKMESQVGF